MGQERGNQQRKPFGGSCTRLRRGAFCFEGERCWGTNFGVTFLGVEWNVGVFANAGEVLAMRCWFF